MSRRAAASKPRLRVNIAANFAGQLFSMFMGVVFTPLYLHFLGVEAYGLIGFHLTLQGALAFLEMGLSRGCNRELARLSGQGGAARRDMLDTLRTLEVLYWGVALALGGGLTLAASWIATSWIEAPTLAPEIVERAVTAMAWVIALRWPVGLYNGAIMGMQRHVQMNLARFAASLVAGGGAVLVLWLVRPDIDVYFRWQLVSAAFWVLLVLALAWRALPGAFMSGRFTLSALRRIAGFAAGVGLNALLGTALRQADKLVLSALLPLDLFGYYALTSMLAGTVSLGASAVSNAIFPRFSQQVGAAENEAKISGLYHSACQVVAVLILPFGIGVALFAPEALFVYTGRADVVEHASMVLALLVLARVLHASMIVPYALQLAHGWLRLSVAVNVVSVAWLIPAIYALVGIWGMTGAALAWFVVTVGYVLVGQPLMHRRLLRGEFGRWMMGALVLPALGTTAFWGLVRLGGDWLPEARLPLGAALAGLGFVSIVVSAMCAPLVRRRLLIVLFQRSAHG